MTTAPKQHWQGVRATEIGSLPHSSVDAALEHSLGLDIPFLPQIPLRNPGEFMIAQALEGLPGLQIEEDGNARLSLDMWKSHADRLDRRLDAAFAPGPAGGESRAFEEFEPTAGGSAAWQPFLWELEERHHKLAKVQIAGPLTCQLGLRIDAGPGRTPSDDDRRALEKQVMRLLLARALGMARALGRRGIEALLFVDEPGLYGLRMDRPRGWAGFQELKIFVQTLARESGAQIGLHCCSNTDWAALMDLPLDYLSLDAGLSLEPALLAGSGQALKHFVARGGRIALGIVPTARTVGLHHWSAQELWTWMTEPFGDSTRAFLDGALLTPACGLAYRSIADAEDIREMLREITRIANRTLGFG